MKHTTTGTIRKEAVKRGCLDASTNYKPSAVSKHVKADCHLTSIGICMKNLAKGASLIS